MSPEEQQRLLSSMGYDENLYSLKARVFIMTFHAIEPIKVRLNDNLLLNLHKIAQNSICHDYLQKQGLGPKSREFEGLIIAQIKHPLLRASWYAALNNTDEPIIFGIDMR